MVVSGWGGGMKELSGKNPDGTNKMYRLGHFFFVINPEFFMGLDTFRKTAGDICRELRASEKAPGAERIYTAGEKEWEAWQDRKDKGVPVGESIQKELIGLRDRFGLDYTFPFEAVLVATTTTGMSESMRAIGPCFISAAG